MVSLAERVPEAVSSSGSPSPTGELAKASVKREAHVERRRLPDKSDEGYDFLDDDAIDGGSAAKSQFAVRSMPFKDDIMMLDDDVIFSDWSVPDMKSQLVRLFDIRKQQVEDLKNLRYGIDRLRDRLASPLSDSNVLSDFALICDNCCLLKPCIETYPPCHWQRHPMKVLLCLECLIQWMDGSWFHNRSLAVSLEMTNRHIANLTHLVMELEKEKEEVPHQQHHHPTHPLSITGHADPSVPALSLTPASPRQQRSPNRSSTTSDDFDPIQEDTEQRRKAVDALHASWTDLLHMSALSPNTWPQLVAMGILSADDSNDLLDVHDKSNPQLSNQCLLTIIQAKPHSIINSFLQFADQLRKDLLTELSVRQKSRGRARSVSPTATEDPELSQRSHLGPSQLSGRIHMPTRSLVAATYTWKILMNDRSVDKLKLWRGLDAIGFLELSIKLVGHRHHDNGIEVTVLKGYDFKCWSRLRKKPNFSIYVKCFVTFEHNERKADKMKTQRAEPRREPVFGSVLTSPLVPRYIDDMRLLKVQIWEYSGRFHRRLPVGHATIDLVRLRLDNTLIGSYPMFVPPPESLDASSVVGEDAQFDRSLSFMRPEFVRSLYEAMTPVPDADDTMFSGNSIDGMLDDSLFKTTDGHGGSAGGVGMLGVAVLPAHVRHNTADTTHGSMVVEWNSSGEERDDVQEENDVIKELDDVIASADASSTAEPIQYGKDYYPELKAVTAGADADKVIKEKDNVNEYDDDDDDD
eukprot:scpid55000/ scgid13413/ 